MRTKAYSHQRLQAFLLILSFIKKKKTVFAFCCFCMSVADFLSQGEQNISVHDLNVTGSATFAVPPSSNASITVSNPNAFVAIGNSGFSGTVSQLIFNGAGPGPSGTSVIAQSNTTGILTIANNDTNSSMQLSVVGASSFVAITAGEYIELTAPGGVLNELPVSSGGGVYVASGQQIETQATSPTTNVNLNSTSGVITLFPSTLAAQANSTFVVFNSNIVGGASVPLVSVCGYTGSTGIPAVIISTFVTGSCRVVLYNTASAAALNGTVSIALYVV
jgi:hypothetical protein